MNKKLVACLAVLFLTSLVKASQNNNDSFIKLSSIDLLKAFSLTQNREPKNPEKDDEFQDFIKRFNCNDLEIVIKTLNDDEELRSNPLDRDNSYEPTSRKEVACIIRNLQEEWNSDKDLELADDLEDNKMLNVGYYNFFRFKNPQYAVVQGYCSSCKPPEESDPVKQEWNSWLKESEK